LIIGDRFSHYASGSAVSDGDIGWRISTNIENGGLG